MLFFNKKNTRVAIVTRVILFIDEQLHMYSYSTKSTYGTASKFYPSKKTINNEMNEGHLGQRTRHCSYKRKSGRNFDHSSKGIILGFRTVSERISYIIHVSLLFFFIIIIK